MRIVKKSEITKDSKTVEYFKNALEKAVPEDGKIDWNLTGGALTQESMTEEEIKEIKKFFDDLNDEQSDAGKTEKV